MRVKFVIPVLASILILGTLTANPLAFSDHQPIEVIEFTNGNLSCTMTTFEGGSHFDHIPDIPGAIFAPTVFPSATVDTWRTITSGGYSNNPSVPTVAIVVGPSELFPRDILFDPPVSLISFFHSSGFDLEVNVYDVDDNLLQSNIYPATPGFSVWDFVSIDVESNEISRAEFLMSGNQYAIDDLTFCVGPDVPTFDSLREQILSLGLDNGLENALISKVDAAEQQFEAGNFQAAINILNAFINQSEAQTGKKIDPADAAELMVTANNLIAQITPNNPPTIESVSLSQDGIELDPLTSATDESKDTLCTANSVMDIDGDLVTLEYKWFDDTGTQVGTEQVLPGNTAIGSSIITCEVTPFDGIDFGDPVSITITNLGGGGA